MERKYCDGQILVSIQGDSESRSYFGRLKGRKNVYVEIGLETLCFTYAGHFVFLERKLIFGSKLDIE